MSSSLVRPPYSTESAYTSDKGLLALSPELILEIASHIVSWDGLRSTRRDSNSFAEWNEKSTLATEKTNLANLRLVCRYLGEVLRGEIFKSLTFNFHVTQSTAADVESYLAFLARGDTPASRHGTFLRIKCLDPIQEGYGWIPNGYFSPQSPGYDNKMRAKTESILRSTNAHLEMAVLSFRNLRCIAWDIEQFDAQGILIMAALSSLPSLEDLTLQFGPHCKYPSHLRIGKFRGLLSLAITLNSHPTLHDRSQKKSLVEVVDHFSDIINQSPFLRHLSILQSRSPREYYDISLLKLTKKISGNLPLINLEALHMALLDIVLDNARALQHLKALKSLHIDCPVYSPTVDDYEPELWKALVAAKIELQYITISWPSNALLDYLASYSGLKKLHVLLTYFSPLASMRCNTQFLFNDILPLHSLSLKIASNLGDLDPFDPLIQEGLVFETGKDDHLYSTIALSWHFRICWDSIPSALSFVLESATQSLECRTERIQISYSSSMQVFPRGDVNGRLRYSQMISRAERKWISDLEVAEQDVRRYPRSIILERKEYNLEPSQGEPMGLYSYRSTPRRKGV